MNLFTWCAFCIWGLSIWVEGFWFEASKLWRSSAPNKWISGSCKFMPLINNESVPWEVLVFLSTGWRYKEAFVCTVPFQEGLPCGYNHNPMQSILVPVAFIIWRGPVRLPVMKNGGKVSCGVNLALPVEHYLLWTIITISTRTAEVASVRWVNSSELTKSRGSPLPHLLGSFDLPFPWDTCGVLLKHTFELSGYTEVRVCNCEWG